MLRKKILAVLLVGIILASVSAVYAGYWIYSQLMTVNVTNYSLTIDKTLNGLEVTIFGQLLNPMDIAVANADVEIHRCDADGVIIATLTTVTTDVDGRYSHVWTAPTEGTYYFKSAYFVP